MKRNETQRYAANRFNKVVDGRTRRARGQWERNGVDYAQVQVQSWVGRVPLEHCGTVASAADALQDLKSKIRAGTFVPTRRRQAGEELAHTGSPASFGSQGSANAWLRILSRIFIVLI